MQEEVDQKTIALSMKAGKFTAQVLQAALKKYLQHRAKGKTTLHHGQQSLKQLKKHGAALSNIEITDANIGLFRPCAKKYGVELMSQDEIATMDGGKCILQVRGVRPFFSEKYDITRHPRYKYLSDADKKNYFDVDRYLTALRRKRQRVVSQEETFDLYDIDLSDEDMAAVDE